MKEIELKDYNRFYKSVKELDWHLSSLAVIKGNNPGKIYSNCLEDPKAAFITSPEGWYLIGDPCIDEFNKGMRTIAQNELMKYKKEMEIIFDPKWSSTALDIFRDFKLRSYKRFHYLVEKANYRRESFTDNNRKAAVQICSDFVRNNLEMTNMKHVNSWILHNWGSYENFKEKGFGYYILEDDTVVSWSVCDCVAGSRCEIGIWADRNYRLKGNASSVVNAMLMYAFDNGFKEVGWHCSWDNEGSYKTAERNGFIREREYLSYYSGSES